MSAIATAIVGGCLTGAALGGLALGSKGYRLQRDHTRRARRRTVLKAAALRAEWDAVCDAAGIPQEGDQLGQLEAEIRKHGKKERHAH